MTDQPEHSGRAEIKGPGELLRRAREKRGLSLHDIAQELHLDEWMLKALEEDNFTALGAPVFAKGHMRKYGGMLGLNSDDLMIAYYRKRGRDDSPPPITKMMMAGRSHPGFSWHALGWILVAAVAIGGVILVWAIMSQGEDPQIPVAAPVPSSSTGSLPIESADRVAETTAVEAAVEEAEPVLPAANTQAGDDVVANPPSPLNDQAATTGRAVVSEQPSVSGNVNSVTPPAAASRMANSETIEVRLTFSGESWVEVTDSAGQQLIFAMMTAGRARTVAGRPPIEIFLGNSRAVQVYVGGESYSIPRSAIRGNTARFVIDFDSR